LFYSFLPALSILNARTKKESDEERAGLTETVVNSEDGSVNEGEIGKSNSAI
jgi:hypothetical protein